MNEVVPVTLLSGFLGAGKTTLLNYYLTHKDNRPVVVLENEFGAENIDGALLNGGPDIHVVELSNGCVCCSVRGEFTAALKKMLDKRATGELPFERLIVETTGLADPGPIIQSFFVDNQLRDALRLDAVIVLADAQHICQQLDEHPVAAAQLGFADRILLTKTDCVDDQQKNQALLRIHKINRKAEIFEIIKGECPASFWLDLNAFALTDSLKLAEGFHVIRADQLSNTSFKPFRQPPVSQSWDDVIQAHLFETGILDIKKVGAFMERCIARFGNDMLRYKGVLAIADHPQRLIVQGVYKVVGFDYGSPWQPQESRTSKLVIIGRYLPIETLRQEFSASVSDV